METGLLASIVGFGATAMVVAATLIQAFANRARTWRGKAVHTVIEVAAGAGPIRIDLDRIEREDPSKIRLAADAIRSARRLARSAL